MSIKQFVRFEDINQLHLDIEKYMNDVFEQSKSVDLLEQEKMRLWDAYVASLDKYVASHYPNQASKDYALEQFDKDFMTLYYKALDKLQTAKHYLMLANNNLNRARNMIELAKVIEAEE